MTSLTTDSPIAILILPDLNKLDTKTSTKKLICQGEKATAILGDRRRVYTISQNRK